MPLKVLHGPHNIGDQAIALAAAERKQHVSSDVALVGSQDARAQKCFTGIGGGAFLNRVQFALRAAVRYDVLHLYFASSFLELGERWDALFLKEAELARRLGREVFFTLQGCDVRLASKNYLPEEGRACRTGYCDKFDLCVGERDADRQRRIEVMQDLASGFFVVNPDLVRSLPEAEFLPYAVDLSAIDAVSAPVPPARPKGEPIRIVHAPTDPTMKGSPQIEAAIAELSKDWPIEFSVVSRLSKADLWQQVAEADLVIDQCLLGWYGAFATEAMALGKPVLAFVRDADLQIVPPAMLDELPIQNIHPDTLAEDIGAVLARPDEWADIGEAGYYFAHRWHNSESVASATIRKYLFPDQKLDVAAFVPNREAIRRIRTA